MKDHIGVVVGGAESVWDELLMAQELVRETGKHCMYYACNDMIADFSKPCRAVTLHVAKLPGWLAERKANGFPDPTNVWMCTQEQGRLGAEFATDIAKDWGGSVGLFAAKVALIQVDKVILCGVPMSIMAGHYKRKTPWIDRNTFMLRWKTYLPEIIGKVRSFSGMTKEWLGSPTSEWVRGEGHEGQLQVGD